MNYEQVIIELLSRIEKLEETVASIQSVVLMDNEIAATTSIKTKGIKKYQALTDFFLNSEDNSVRLTFSQIEQILGFSLPASARDHRAFWANTTTHSIANSWLSCEFETEAIYMDKETVIFSKNRRPRIDDLMVKLVEDLVQNFGSGYTITTKEIRQEMEKRYGINPTSVLPADYCYNRVNRGINIKAKPTLFEYNPENKKYKHPEDIEYKCLGRLYPYNGDIYWRKKEEKQDKKVGVCENGIRKIDPEYCNEFNL